MKALDKLLNWYFRRGALPYWVMLIIDCLIVFLSGVFIYYLFHRGLETLLASYALLNTLVVYLVLTILCFRLFSTYAGVIRYSSFVDLQKVGYANMLAMALCIGAHYVMLGLPTKSYAYMSVVQIVAMYLIATMLMWGVRVLAKVIYDVVTSDKNAMRVFIYGTDSDSIGLAKNIRSQKPTTYLLKGFVSNEERYKHRLLIGERVYSLKDNLTGVIRKKNIEGVLVSPQRIKEFRKEQELQDLLINAGVKIFMVRTEQEWDGHEETQAAVQLHEVSVEDLLPRDEIKIDMASVGSELEGRRVLITGAAGSIGSEMVRQVAEFRPASMLLIDQAETPAHDLRLMIQASYPDIQAAMVVTSICKVERMEKLFADFRPDYVFHAAAYKHVPMMEDNPSEAVENNINGTKIIADLAVKYGVKKFVMVSTDKAVNPTNVMGCSKRICEIYVQSLNRAIERGEKLEASGKKQEILGGSKTQFVTTRFGNVLGSNGSVIPLFREQIKKGGPVTVTHPKIIRYFMLIPEACKLVLEAGVKGHGGEIFAFDMGQPVKIADLAKRMIRLSGVKNVKIAYTGLRAGEKLYEEVLDEHENVKTSFHEKIRIAKVREYDYKAINQGVKELIAIAQKYDNMATVRKMKEIVPEYKSNNSIYEQLDQ